MKQSSRLLLSAAAVVPSVYGQLLVNQGGDQVCVDPVHTIVYEYPAYFSSVFETAGTIYNFFGGTNSMVINNVPQTVITSTILTSTLTTTATRTSTVTERPGGTIAPGTPVTLGAGLPSGTVDAISAASPIKLAYVVDAVGGRRPKGYVSADGSSGDDEAAPEFYLQDGQLRTTDGQLVGRNEDDTYALIAPTSDDKEITTVFSFVDGVLQWVSPDRGSATFYECPDGLYAGFPDAPSSDCDKAMIGGVTVDAIAASKEDAVSTTSGASVSSSMSSLSSASSSSSGSSSPSSLGAGSVSSSASSTSGSSPATSSGSASSNGSSSPSATGSSSATSGTGSSTSDSESTSVSSTLSETSSSSSGSSDTSSSMTTDDNSDSSTSSSTSASPTPTTESDADICTAGTYEGYDVQCGHASSGAGDLGNTREDSFRECIITCFITDGCLSIDYKIDGGFCYMHTARADPAFIRADATFDYAQLAEETDGGDGSDGSDSGNGGDSGDGGDGGDSSDTSTMTSTTMSSMTSSSATTTSSAGGSSMTTTSSSATTMSTTGSGGSSTTSTDSATVTTTSVTTLSVTLSSSSTTSTTTSSSTSSTTSTTSSSSSSTTTTTTTLPLSTTTTSSTTASTTTTTTTSLGVTTTTTSSTTSTTTTTTTTTTSSGGAAGTPAGVSNPAPSGTKAGAAACRVDQCPVASTLPTYIANNGYYYAKYSGPNQGLNAVDLSGNNVQQYDTFDLCLAACATRVSTAAGDSGNPCISVSYNTVNKNCYFHQQCRDTTLATNGVNSDANFVSAEKVPFNCK